MTNNQFFYTLRQLEAVRQRLNRDFSAHVAQLATMRSDALAEEEGITAEEARARVDEIIAREYNPPVKQ